MPLPLMNHLPYPALENWTNLLVTAKAALDTQPTGGGAPDNDNTTPTLWHLRKMYQHNTNIHHMKILSNFETASMHLRYLLEGNLDLPTKKAEFVPYLQSHETSTPLTTIEQMIAPFEMAGLRLPLQAAMTLSPICLLVNMALNIHAVTEDKLCRVWRCLGGNRPALLQVTELAIWNIIWDHSQNFTSPREADTQSSRDNQSSQSKDHLTITTGRDSNEDRPEDNTTAMTCTEPQAGASQDGNQPIPCTMPTTTINDDVTMGKGSLQATSAAADGSPSLAKGKRKAQTKGLVRSAGMDMQVDTQGAEPSSGNAAQSTNPVVSEVRQSSRSKGSAKPQISASVGALQPGIRKGNSKRAGGHKSKSLGKVSSSSHALLVGPANSTVVPPDHEVIDLTIEEDNYDSPPLNPIDNGQTKYPANAYQLWMPDGSKGPLHCPSFYFPADMTWFNNMMDAAESYYIDGKPHYVSAPSTSVFKILAEDEFENLSDKAVQEFFCNNT